MKVNWKTHLYSYWVPSWILVYVIPLDVIIIFALLECVLLGFKGKVPASVWHLLAALDWDQVFVTAMCQSLVMCSVVMCSVVMYCCIVALLYCCFFIWTSWSWCTASVTVPLYLVWVRGCTSHREIWWDKLATPYLVWNSNFFWQCGFRTLYGRLHASVSAQRQ